MTQKLYFRQLLAGRDFAKDDPNAKGMENFVYLIGDIKKRECAVVDAAWDIDGILDIANKDGMKIVAALATHYHPDHVGGDIFSMNIEGLAKLLSKNPCLVHAHKLEKSGIIKVTGLSDSDIVAHDSGDIVKVGDIEIKLLHTPGHTPGSICFSLNNSLISGDTLFLRSCGRVDLPGGDVEEMYRTINDRLSTLSNNTIVFPGHAYKGNKDSMGNIKEHNPVFKFMDLKTFKGFFNR